MSDLEGSTTVPALTRGQIMVQAATQSLLIANSQPQTALSLLG